MKDDQLTEEVQRLAQSPKRQETVTKKIHGINEEEEDNTTKKCIVCSRMWYHMSKEDIEACHNCNQTSTPKNEEDSEDETDDSEAFQAAGDANEVNIYIFLKIFLLLIIHDNSLKSPFFFFFDF